MLRCWLWYHCYIDNSVLVLKNKVICSQSEYYFISPRDLHQVNMFKEVLKRSDYSLNTLYRAGQRAGVILVCHLDQQIPDRCFILLVTLRSKIAYYRGLITVMEWVQSDNNILYQITVYLLKCVRYSFLNIAKTINANCRIEEMAAF